MKTLSGLTNVLLFVTNTCNLKCEYCYVRQGKDFMSFSLAKKVINNIDDGTIVDMFGGEALLHIELIEQIVNYIKKNNRHIILQLFSNGTRYDDRVKKLLENGVNIGVSCDGIDAFYRTHSDDITKQILNNIIQMKKDNPRLSIKTSITPQNVSRLVENVQYLNNLGFNKISHFILRENVWNEQDIHTYEEQMKLLVKYYDNHINDYILDYLDGFIIGQKRKFGCWAGRDGVAVNFNGDLYPCQRFLTNGSPYIIGNVNTGITNHMFQRYDIAKFVGCKKCESFNQCNNVCIASQWESGMLTMPIKCVCELTKISYKSIIPLLHHKEFINQRILRYINGK